MAPKLKFALYAIAVILAALALRTLWTEHDARVKAEATQAAQALIIANAQKTIDSSKADQAKIAEQLSSRIAAVEVQKRAPVTAPQFVVDASKLLNLPKPLEVVQPAAGAKDAPAVQIPAEDLQALRNFKLDCDETGAKLEACTADSTELKVQEAALKTQTEAVTRERDTWKTAAKGGTFWHRTLTAAKWVAIGAAAGYAAGKVAH